jgi:hypothetical protein
MTIWEDIKLAVAVVLFLILAVFLISVGSMYYKNARLESELTAATIEVQGLRQEIEAGRAALERREAEKMRLATENAALATIINEVYQNDPKAKTWADAACPDGVIECLR